MVVLTALKTLDEVLALLLAADTHVLLLLTSVGALVVRLSGLLRLLGRGRTTTKEHVGKSVAHRGTNGYTGGGGSHLTKETR